MTEADVMKFLQSQWDIIAWGYDRNKSSWWINRRYDEFNACRRMAKVLTGNDYNVDENGKVYVVK